MSDRPTRRPRVVCLMTSSIDGRLHPSRYTESPDGDVAAWDAVYAAEHDAIGADAWMVGRVTMAEMTKGEAPSPATDDAPPRPVHRAPGAAPHYAVAPDTRGELDFAGPAIGGDHVVVLLGAGVGDDHLRRLVAAGVSYVVSAGRRPDLAAALATLNARFGVERLALEGGGAINGAMIAAGLVDELRVLVVPALDGDDGREGIVRLAGGLKGKARLSLIDAAPRDHGTVLLRYRLD